MKNKRIRLLADVVVKATKEELPDISLNRGFIFDAIQDNYGCVQLILPKHLIRNINKKHKVDLPKENYGFKQGKKSVEKIIGRRYTKYMDKIRVEYLHNSDEGTLFEFVK